MTPISLVSLDDAKAALQVREGNTDHDPRLLFLIETASETIEQATDRWFTRAVRTQDFRTARSVTVSYDLFGSSNEDGLTFGARTQRFVLRGCPFDPTQPLDVRYDPMRGFGDDTKLDPSSYTVRIDPVTGGAELLLRYGTSDGDGTLRVTYTAGFEVVDGVLADVPRRLAMGCLAQVMFLWAKTLPENIGMGEDTSKKSRSVNGGRFLSASGLTPEAAEFVSQYRALLMGRG